MDPVGEVIYAIIRPALLTSLIKEMNQCFTCHKIVKLQILILFVQIIIVINRHVIFFNNKN